jgi:hypothetical protein
MRWDACVRPCVALTTAATLLLAPLCESSAVAAGPPTIYDNYQSFPVGSRAAGMGGAYTSLACDEGAVHYNPAALGCASDSHLELAANAYLIQGLSLPNAVGRGEDISAITYHSIPSIVGGVRILLEGDPQTRAGRLAFGLTVSVPHSVALKVDPPTPDKVNYISLSVRDDITAGDLGLGYQLTSWLGIGLSAGVVLRTYESHEQILITRTTPSKCGLSATGTCTDFFFPVNDQELLAVGGRFKVGARLTPAPHLAIGVAVVTPTFNIYGSSKITETDALGLTDTDASGKPASLWAASPIRLTGKSSVGFPLRVAAGVSYAWPRFTLSLDGSVNLPGTVAVASSLEAIKIRGSAAPDAKFLAARDIELAVQPNVNLGAEIAITDTKVIDLGAFTDFSSVSDQQIQRDRSDRVHMFGGSLALGILGRQSRGWFGASFEMGSADTAVPNGNYDLDSILQGGIDYNATSTVTRWTLSGVIGSNYAFVKE